jgi:hypothetical protein
MVPMTKWFVLAIVAYNVCAQMILDWWPLVALLTIGIFNGAWMLQNVRRYRLS